MFDWPSLADLEWAPKGLRHRFLNRLALTVSLAALAGSLIGTSAAALLAPADGLAEDGGFELVGTHPQASQQSQQPTARGRTLHFLKHWNGAIYAGYGDYGFNTGPIAITPFALSTNQFAAQPAFWANTEELEVFRPLNGRLFAPSIDPVDRIPPPDDYSETGPAGTWLGRDVVNAFHVFDMAERAGGELWMVGSSGDNAVAWRWRATARGDRPTGCQRGGCDRRGRSG